MTIVISGVNNNDKITASDGKIDILSGVDYNSEVTAPSFKVGSDIQLGNAGVATATTFVGNLTGNVNNTGNLLLQIGGSEKFRVGGSGQLGIGGANYGTSGQVLTSGGSGSAATWSTVSGVTINNNADNRVITGSGTANTLNGESSLTYDGSKLFIGNTSFSNLNTSADDLVIGTESSGVNAGLSIITHSGNIGHLLFGDQDGGTRGGFRYQHSVDNLQGYSGGSAPFNLKSNALGLHENYPIANSITIRGANTDDTPLLILKRHTDGAQSDGEIIGKIQFMSNENNVDSGNHQPRAEIHGVTVNTSGAAKLDFYTVPNSTTTPIKRMTLNQEGQLTVPSQIGFHAGGTNTYNRTSSFVPEFDSEYFDIGGGYNHTNYRFTAPIAGRYFLYFQYLTYPNADPAYKTFLFRKNGSSSGLYDQGFYRGKEGMQGNQTSQQVSTYIQLAANDYIEPYVEMSGGTFYNYMGSGHAHFWGFLVH